MRANRGLLAEGYDKIFYIIGPDGRTVYDGGFNDHSTRTGCTNLRINGGFNDYGTRTGRVNLCAYNR